MKKLTALLLSFFSVAIYAQQNVGIGTSSPNASAVLDITSSTKGVLIPRMTEDRRNAISNPAQGLLIYQTDGAVGFYVNKSTLPNIPNWSPLSEGGSFWSYQFNSTSNITNNNTGNIGIGVSVPAYLMDINGRIRLRHNNNTPGIWLNKSDNTEGTFIGMISDSVTGFWGNSSIGAWSMAVDVKNRRVGIDNSAPTAPLSFKNTDGNKIDFLYLGADARYGIGIKGPHLQYYTSGSNADHVFGYGSNTNFSEAMRIKGNGDVGIGTASPNAKLNVITNTGTALLATTSSISSSQPVVTVQGGTISLVTDKRVGVGTSTPQAQLEVSTDSRNILQLTNTASLAVNVLNSIYFKTGNTYTGMIETRGTATNAAAMSFLTSASSSPSGLTERLTIADNGNVGINTSNPAFKLDVFGRLRLRYNLVDGPAGLWFNKTDNTQGSFIGQYDDTNLGIWGPGASGSWKFLFDGNDGTVRIGTTQKASGYLVNVGGKVIAEEVRVQLRASWPDYVFAKDYKLAPLYELEEYIHSHQHLPGLQPAAQIEKEGADLGETQRKLVEKVEELTLYVIELKKEIDQLKSK
jgi:hypothetical protein